MVREPFGSICELICADIVQTLAPLSAHLLAAQGSQPVLPFRNCAEKCVEIAELFRLYSGAHIESGRDPGAALPPTVAFWNPRCTGKGGAQYPVGSLPRLSALTACGDARKQKARNNRS
jgi:hypothetical protein